MKYVGLKDADNDRFAVKSETANEQFIILSAAYTLTSQTAAQKLFNSPANGTVTLAGSTTYYFECFYTLTAMSATSGAFGFALGGTAVLGSQSYISLAIKTSGFTAAASATNASNTLFSTAANTAISGAINVNTNGIARITGHIRVTTGGTLIPQVSLTIAAAAIVGLNSFFRIRPIGSNTVQSVGSWT